MLPEKIIYIGVFINLIGIFWYIKTIFYGETRPNLVSWVVWMLAPFVGVFLQLKAGAGLSVMGTFMAGFGPFLVIVFSLIKRNAFWRVTTFDIVCGALAVLSLVIYILTNKLGISILFAILSDTLASIPTIIKSWKSPESESASTYLSSILTNVLSLLIITNWIFSIYAFSIYFLIINGTIVILIKRVRINKLFR